MLKLYCSVSHNTHCSTGTASVLCC